MIPVLTATNRQIRNSMQHHTSPQIKTLTSISELPHIQKLNKIQPEEADVSSCIFKCHNTRPRMRNKLGLLASDRPCRLAFDGMVDRCETVPIFYGPFWIRDLHIPTS